MKTKHILYLAVILALIAGWALPSSTLAAPPPVNLITVTNLNDSGPGSLRDAIDQANSDGIASAIIFKPTLIGGSILLQSELPGLYEDGTMIDGDIDKNHQPDIEISGQDCGGCTGLHIPSSHNLVRGLAMAASAGAVYQ